METLYLKGLYERLTLPSGNVEHKYYVGDTVVIDSTDAKQSKTLYSHKDHLGSTVTVTDANGSVVQHINYDAWGKQNRFYTSSSLVSLLNQQSPVESKGYTGHKEISDLGIIHMNGRIYDPTLGRFLQADPFIQFPNNSQSYNRYSYVLNNPMSFTDPSGYFLSTLWGAGKQVFDKIAAPALRKLAQVPVLNAVVQVVGCFYSGPGCPVFLSAYNGAQTQAVTGSLGAALRSAAISYASGYALQGIGNSAYWGQAGSIQNIAANAMVGGITAKLQGGKFGHGFFAAGVVSAFKPAINNIGGENSANSAIARGDLQALEIYKVHRVIAAAAIGGTVSVVSGGKFANGALTGAFTQMLNGESQNEYKAQYSSDRRKIIEAFERSVKRMDSYGLRLNGSGKINGSLNNMKSFFGGDNLGCGGQALELYRDIYPLSINGSLDLNWNIDFMYESGTLRNVFPHQWLEIYPIYDGVPQQLDRIYLDPWLNEVGDVNN